jgi:hypothetical protein
MLGEDIKNWGGRPHKLRLWELRKGLNLGTIPIGELLEEGRE